MPKKKPTVPTSYLAAIAPALNVVSDSLVKLLSESVDAQWLFTTARLGWSEWVAAPDGTDRQREAGDIARAAISALVDLSYQTDTRLRSIIMATDLTTLITGLASETVHPGSARHAPSIALLKLAHDSTITARREGDRVVLDGAVEASMDELMRAKKALDISEAIRQRRPAPSQGGRRGAYEDEAGFRAAVEPYVRAARKAHGKDTVELVATDLAMTDRHLKRLTHKYTGLDWRAFVATVR